MSLMLIAWTVTMNKMKTSAGENQQWIDTKISSDLKKKEIYTHAFIPLSFYHYIMANIIFTIIITIFMLIMDHHHDHIFPSRIRWKRSRLRRTTSQKLLRELSLVSTTWGGRWSWSWWSLLWSWWWFWYLPWALAV